MVFTAQFGQEHQPRIRSFSEDFSFLIYIIFFITLL